MRLRSFAIAVRELMRDYHVCYHMADKGFRVAVLRSALSILFQ
jgi:hypothetical protein